MTARRTPDDGPPELPRALLREIGLTLDAHDAMDRAWDVLAETNASMPQPGQVACGAGCAACCSYLVDTISTEALVIAASVDRSDPEYRTAVMKRLLDWEYEFHRWQLRHPMPPQSTNRAADLRHDLWRGEWQARRIACPFLDLGSYRCSIYADRPATCRGHHACYPPPDMPQDACVPPEGCFTSWDDLQKGTLTQVWQLNDRVPQTFSKLLADTLDHYGITFTTNLLPIMVLTVGRLYFGWPAPEPLKKRQKPPRITEAKRP